SICVLYLSVLLVIAYWSDSYNETMLKQQLISVIPVFLKITFFLLVLGLVLNLRAVIKILAGLRLKKGSLLVIVILAGLAMSMFVAPRTHRIFYDENIYLNVGQNIAFLARPPCATTAY